MGLESFVRNSSLFILITDHREAVYTEVREIDDLVDGQWHSLTIVHTAQRSSLLASAFHGGITCRLSIYVDGLLRRDIEDFKYVSIVNSSISLASIGSPSQRPASPMNKLKNESLSVTLARTVQPLTGLFSSKMKSSQSRRDIQRSLAKAITNIEPNSQETCFGLSTSLHGQLASVWILAETLDDIQVRHLHILGADFYHQRHALSSSDETSMTATLFGLLSTRSVLVYHPLACNDQICLDVSGCSSPINARLMHGVCVRRYSFSESLSNLGGCPILYPLFELCKANENDDGWCDNESTSDTHQPVDANPMATLIDLLRCSLSANLVTLTEQMTKYTHMEILAEHLSRIPSSLIDQALLIAVEQLIQSSRSIDSSNALTDQCIEHLLLDFKLWNRATIPIRLLHLQSIFSWIKSDPKFKREKFGVQFFLDVLKQHLQ